MKKSLATALFALLLVSAHAQVGGSPFGTNMFLSGQAGWSFYNNKFGLSNGFSGGIAVGKWITNPLALRIGLDLINNTSPQQMRLDENTDAKADYVFATAEFLWDVNATFGRIRNWRLQAYPMVGLGIVWRDSIVVDHEGYQVDHEVQLMLGAHIAYRATQAWYAFAEYKAFFLPQNFDGTPGTVVMHSATLGVTRAFYSTPYHRRTEYESRALGNDWFLGVGLGPNVSSFELEHLSPTDGMWGVAPEVTVGRNLTDFWTLRFQLNGITGRERYDTVKAGPGEGFTFSNLHADLMVNLTHALNFRRGVRLNVLPYLGAGLVWRYDDVKFDMAADFGLFFRYYLSRRSDLYVDAKYLMVPPRIGGGAGPSGKYYGVGLPSLTVGYLYNFGTNTTRYRLPANWCPE